MRANRLGQKLHVFGLEDFRKGLGWALAGGNGQAGVSDLSGRGQTEVEGQAEETLPALLTAGPQGRTDLTNGGTRAILKRACRWIHCLPLAGSFWSGH